VNFMTNPARAALNLLLQTTGYEQLGVFAGYLRGSGWWESVKTKKPVDASGEPLPWYCYPFIHFLEQRLGTRDLSRLRVFEFGSGNSTLWWANRVSEVMAVEDNRNWYEYVRKKLPSNVDYQLAETEGQYVGCLSQSASSFEIIVLDGSYREKCLEHATEHLTDDGVLVVDNSDWDSLTVSLRNIEQRGFRRLEFYGLGPMNGHPWGTSVLYREMNVLGI
jgi:precorrin-6B methylase 2